MIELKETYLNKIAPEIMKSFNISNINALPQIKKVVINSGIGEIRENKEALETFIDELANIAGQQPYPRKAKKSEAGFKIKQGDVVGYAVTLRGDRMWAFIQKLIGIALPRVRDFRGLSIDSFDAEGNYSLGIKEHVIFPEVDPNKTKGIRSLQVSIIFDKGELEINKEILKKLGFPFNK